MFSYGISVFKNTSEDRFVLLFYKLNGFHFHCGLLTNMIHLEDNSFSSFQFQLVSWTEVIGVFIGEVIF